MGDLIAQLCIWSLSLSKGFITGLRPENCSATSCFLFQLLLSFNNYSLIVLCDKIFSVLKHSPSGLLTIKDPDLPANSVKLKIKALPQKGFNMYHIGIGLPPTQPFCNISIWSGGGWGGVMRMMLEQFPFEISVYRTHEDDVSHKCYLLWMSNLVPHPDKTCLLLMSVLKDSFSVQMGTFPEVP